MTKEEKYVMARLTSKLYIETLNMEKENNFTNAVYYEATNLINWTMASNAVKELNNQMRELIGRSRQGEDVEQELDTVYQKKNEEKAKMDTAQMQLHLDSKNITTNADKENYVITRMATLLVSLCTKIDAETEHLINWYSSSQQLKDVNKELTKAYAIAKAKGYPAAADTISSLREQKIELEQTKETSQEEMKKFVTPRKRNAR